MIYFRLILAILVFSPWTMIAHAKIPAITINPKEIGTTGIRLSDLVQSVEYIPLETNGNSLIASTSRRFDVSKTHILLWASLDKILLFERTGRFVTEIGKRGMGPGEYYNVSSVLIDKETNQIELLTGVQGKEKIQRFDMKGKLITETPVTNEIESPFLGRFGRYGLFLKRGNGGNSSSSFTYTLREWGDFKSVGVGGKNAIVKYTEKNYSMNTPIPIPYVRNGNIHVRETSLNDTLYKVTANHTFSPYYIIDAGRYAMTAENMGSKKNFDEFVVFNGELGETEKSFLLSYYFEKKKIHVYCDKLNGQCAVFPSEKGIPNDWDGGPDIWFMRQDEKTMYGFIPASDFLEYKNKLAPKGPQSAIQRMDDLKDSLVDDDNPVFVIVTMK